MVFLSFSYEFRMIFLWFSYMLFLWISDEFPMIFLWFSHDFPMILPWFSYGFPMIFLWFSYSVSPSIPATTAAGPRHSRPPAFRGGEPGGRWVAHGGDGTSWIMAGWCFSWNMTGLFSIYWEWSSQLTNSYLYIFIYIYIPVSQMTSRTACLLKKKGYLYKILHFLKRAVLWR